MNEWLTPRFVAFMSGLAAVVGATVAVCLGDIDASTYIALVASVGGVGVGAGIHAEGIAKGTKMNGNGGGR